MSITSTEYESYSGDDYALALTFTDSTSSIINLTPFTLFVTIKINANDVDTAAVYRADITSTQTTINGGTPTGSSFTNAIGGKTNVTLAHGNTENLKGVYVIDIKYKDGNGLVGTALNGRINFFTDISKRASQ